MTELEKLREENRVLRGNVVAAVKRVEELRGLVKSSFWDGYHQSSHNEGYDDAWRYSSTKTELEKMTGSEYESNEW